MKIAHVLESSMLKKFATFHINHPIDNEPDNQPLNIGDVVYKSCDNGQTGKICKVVAILYVEFFIYPSDKMQIPNFDFVSIEYVCQS